MSPVPAHTPDVTPSPRVGGVAVFGKLRRLLSSQLRVNFASGIGTNVVNVLVMSASYPLYLHFLGYEKLGLWMLISTIQAFAQLGLLGIGPALTKLVAEAHGRGDLAAAQRYVTMATMVLCATGSIVLLTVTLFRHPIVAALHLSGADAAVALRLVPWIGVLTLYTFQMQVVTGSLAGFGRIDLANYCQTAAKVVVLVVEIAMLVAGVGVVALLIGDFIGCAVIQIAGTLLLRRIAGVRLARFGRGAWHRQQFRRLIAFAGGMFTSSLTGLFISPLNKVVLSRFVGVGVVPIYDIAFNGAMQIRGVAETGFRALMPEISHTDARLACAGIAGRKAIHRLYARALAMTAMCGLPLFGGVALLAGPLLKLWLRHKFDVRIVPIFNLMLLSVFLSLIAVPAYYALMGLGRIRHCMASHAIGAAVNVLALLVLTGLLRTVSLQLAGWAVVTSTVAQSLYLLASARRALPPRPSAPVCELDLDSGNGFGQLATGAMGVP